MDHHHIDDSTVAVLDSESNKPMVKRAQQAVPMGLYLTFRPLAGKNEPIQPPDPASIRKMIAEGQLRETIPFLGWFINTRSFTISLPTAKCRAEFWRGQRTAVATHECQRR